MCDMKCQLLHYLDLNITPRDLPSTSTHFTVKVTRRTLNYIKHLVNLFNFLIYQRYLIREGYLISEGCLIIIIIICANYKLTESSMFTMTVNYCIALYLYIYIALLAGTPIRSASSARDPERRELRQYKL